METRKLLASIVAVFVLASVSYAGDLEPGAAPAPTMKTLDEVEPRIAIPGSDTAVGTFTISQSGSYYLTGDRLCSGTGIQVEVDDVTIDLMGYTLEGPGSGNYYGVYMQGGRNNVEVRNGTVREFFNGVYEPNSAGKNHRVINIRAISNSYVGIALSGVSCLVKDCTVSGNANGGGGATGNGTGISTGSGSTVTGNTVYDNGNSATGIVYGINAGSGSTVIGNTVYDNGNLATGTYVYGIRASTGSTVVNNTSRYNGKSATGSVFGMYAYSGCTVTGNATFDNGETATGGFVYGIYANVGSTVTGNNAYNNGELATSLTIYGIYLQGYNLVDQNTCYSNNGTNMNLGQVGCTYGINVAP